MVISVAHGNVIAGQANTQRITHLATRLPAAAQLTSDCTTLAVAMPFVRVVSNTSARTPASNAPAHAPVKERRCGGQMFHCSAHFTFGVSNSCERGEFILALVTRVAAVATRAGTCSPRAAASAVLTPS
jgi:hypothetical protein